MELSSPLQKTMSWQEIRYSQVWEDQDLLRRSLEIQPTDHVVSIGSAGCNALACLLDSPAKVSVVDLSPAQHALLDLRFKAIENLDYEEYTKLFCLGANESSLFYFRKIREQLLQTTAEYFDGHARLLTAGALSQGRLEKYFAYFRENALWKIWSADLRQKLVNTQSLEEQVELLQRFGNLQHLKTAAKTFFGQEGLEQARDREQMRFVTQTSTGEYLFAKFSKILSEQHLPNNPYLYHFILGEAPPSRNRLATDREENYHFLKKNISKINLYHSDLESLLGKFPDESVDKYNLSDIFEYLNPDHCDELFSLLTKKLSKNGRLAFWSLFVDRSPGKNLALHQLQTPGVDRLWLYKDFQVYTKP